MKLIPLTVKEKATCSIYNSFGQQNANLFFENLKLKHPEVALKTLHNVKSTEKKTKGQFGYYHNTRCAELYFFMKKHKKKRICDLGSGAGVLLQTIKTINWNIIVKGFEIEKSLVEYSNTYNNFRTLEKDILTLTKEDLKDQEIIYFWEPLYEDGLAKKFAENLGKVLTKGQLIVYYQSGRIGDHLKKVENFKFLGYWDRTQYQIYKVI